MQEISGGKARKSYAFPPCMLHIDGFSSMEPEHEKAWMCLLGEALLEVYQDQKAQRLGMDTGSRGRSSCLSRMTFPRCANICFSGSAAEKCQTCHRTGVFCQAAVTGWQPGFLQMCLILIDKVGSQMCPNLGS